MHRFTRLTNAFSKKLENHCHAPALYFLFYNFCRIHKTLNIPHCPSGYLGGKEKQGLLPPSFTQLAIAAIQARKDIPQIPK